LSLGSSVSSFDLFPSNANVINEAIISFSPDPFLNAISVPGSFFGNNHGSRIFNKRLQQRAGYFYAPGLIESSTENSKIKFLQIVFAGVSSYPARLTISSAIVMNLFLDDFK